VTSDIARWADLLASQHLLMHDPGGGAVYYEVNMPFIHRIGGTAGWSCAVRAGPRWCAWRLRRPALTKRSTLNRDMDAIRSSWRWLTTKRTDLGMLSVAFPKASEKEKDTKLQKDRIRCLSLVERARMEAAAGPRWQPFFS
jgi:hypothetical protein